MSYKLTIAADARADFSKRDVWLQEEILDELDLVATNPSRLTPVSSGHGALHVFNRNFAGATYCVVISIARNEETRTLVVLGITVDSIPHPPMG